MSIIVKKATNLTGLPVAANSRNRLLALYKKILKEVTKMPESSTYRKSTEELVKFRSAVVEKETCIEEVEKKIGCGQIEELMIQAQNELSLARKFVIWKPWESLKVPTPKNQWNWPAN